MEALLLMLDVFGIAQVLVWAARGRGTAGMLGWQDENAEASPRPRSRRRG